MCGGVEGQAMVVQDVDFRACCGKLRWALLDIVEDLAGQNVRLKALRWGSSEVPLDLDLDSRPSTEVVETVLADAARFLGASSSCFMGGGSLVVERGTRSAGKRR